MFSVSRLLVRILTTNIYFSLELSLFHQYEINADRKLLILITLPLTNFLNHEDGVDDETCLYSLPFLFLLEPQVFLGMNIYFLLYNLYERRRRSLNRLLYASNTDFPEPNCNSK